MNSKLFIKNAKIVKSSSIHLGNVLLEDGKIKEIGDLSLETKDNIPILDAQNQYLLPGGIDAHVHFHLKTANGLTTDNFESGSRAALAGGTTTIIDFITPQRNEDLKQALLCRQQEVGQIYTDYSFHQSITHWDENTAKQMEEAVLHDGITSFKTYLAYSDSIGIDLTTLEKVMLKARELQAIVLVHAEVGEMIDEWLNNNDHQKLNPGFIHKKSHSIESETEAIKKVVALARKTSCKTYIVHVSTEEGMNIIKNAKNEGVPVFAETCPQYFVFENKIYSKKDKKTINYILSPPIRSIEDREGIIQAVANNNTDCISTDHCSFSSNLKYKNSEDYKKIPHGVGGVQYRLMLFYQSFISHGYSTWIDMARQTAENPAEIFGLKSKGKIEIGYDADLVLMKILDERIKIKQLPNYSKSDINVYQDIKISAIPSIIIKGGQIVYENNHLLSDIPSGKFIKRSISNN